MPYLLREVPHYMVCTAGSDQQANRTSAEQCLTAGCRFSAPLVYQSRARYGQKTVPITFLGIVIAVIGASDEHFELKGRAKRAKHGARAM